MEKSQLPHAWYGPSRHNFLESLHPPKILATSSGTPRGKALSVIITALLLVGAFTLTLMTTQPDHAYNDGVFDHKSFSSCLWFAWGCFFDPGTHTALPHDENLYTKTVAVVFSIFGFLYNCVVLGIVVDGVRG